MPCGAGSDGVGWLVRVRAVACAPQACRWSARHWPLAPHHHACARVRYQTEAPARTPTLQPHCRQPRPAHLTAGETDAIQLDKMRMPQNMCSLRLGQERPLARQVPPHLHLLCWGAGGQA